MLPPFMVMGCFTIGTAFSRNAASILLTRFVGGIFASAPISNVPAALGDMWSPEVRGIAMAFVSICISGGPTLGPIIGAAVVIRPGMDWRCMFPTSHVAFLITEAMVSAHSNNHRDGIHRGHHCNFSLSVVFLLSPRDICAGSSQAQGGGAAQEHGGSAILAST